MMHELLVPSAPTTYTLEITSHCNSACIGCGNVFQRTLGEMAVEKWHSLLTNLSPYIVNLRLTGGEPTLYAEFNSLVRFVDELRVPFVVF
jgi:MoaA/NifB/PqqE/SkfB family radical SAM enzyme